jgi:superfamily II DNA/RNA helicase
MQPDAVTTTPDHAFTTLGLSDLLLRAVQAAGYTSATPVQAQAIPEVLAGHDLMVCAQTGTGKTAAFMLPALQRLAADAGKRPIGAPRVLVLTPTRELAQQVTDAAMKYGKFLRHASVAAIVGGVSYIQQNRALAQQLDILVATPGRLTDHLTRGRLDLSRVELLVLDEADRMLDMGFVEAVEHIAGATPAQRQTLLFSATLDGAIARLARRILRAPRMVSVEGAKERHANIEQRLHFVDDRAHKDRLLEHLLRDAEVKQAIVFTATKRDADDIAGDLQSQGHAVAALHGDMNQHHRTRALSAMKQGRIRVLVATDVAARGIDVAGISHVINYDLPRDAESYVHRIGRTGRAGAKGLALSFAHRGERGLLARIEGFTGQRIAAHVVPGFEPKPRPQGDARSPGRNERWKAKPASRSAPAPRAGQARGRPAARDGDDFRQGRRTAPSTRWDRG